METPRRYRITVTPLEPDGLPCYDRCSLEFDHSQAGDLMRRVEAASSGRVLAGDEATALVLGLSLLEALALHGSATTQALLAPLSAALEQQAERTWNRTRR